VFNFCVGCSDRDSTSPELIGEQVEAGIESLRVFNFQSAYRVLSIAQPNLDKDAESWLLATYSLALAAWHKSPPSHEALIEAESLLEQVIEQDPKSEFAASALLDLGRIEEVSDFLGDSTDVPAAQVYYKQVIREFPATEMSARATAFLAQSMAQSFDSESVRDAIKLLESEIAAQPDSPWVGTLSQYVAQLYAFYLHDSKASLQPYERAMEVGFPRSADSDISLWQFGLLAQKAGEDIMAARVYSRLVKKYPRSIYGTVARERVIQIAQAHPDRLIQIPDLRGLSIGR
jgi:tetratricopeptide (TPR) repeat protein